MKITDTRTGIVARVVRTYRTYEYSHRHPHRLHVDALRRIWLDCGGGMMSYMGDLGISEKINGENIHRHANC
jgi:hypothetical protein